MINTEPEEQQGTKEESLKESIQCSWKPAVHEEWQWKKWIWKDKNRQKAINQKIQSIYLFNNNIIKQALSKVLNVQMKKQKWVLGKPIHLSSTEIRSLRTNVISSMLLLEATVDLSRCPRTGAVNSVSSMTMDDRDLYRCKVAAVGAGLTSISVQFPSLSWRTSSESEQTYTGKWKGKNVNPFLEIHIWFTIKFYWVLVFKKALLGHKIVGVLTVTIKVSTTKTKRNQISICEKFGLYVFH